jgi:hypothetical protein
MRIRRARAAIAVAALVALTLLTTTLAPAAASPGQPADDPGGRGGGCRAGAPGVGDDYYPLYGNGGYDVRHYLLKVSYNPASDRLAGWPPSPPAPPSISAGSTSTSKG